MPKTGQTFSKLDMTQSARLIPLIEAEFPSRGETDEAFAHYATAKLGFTVSGTAVQTRRQALGIAGHSRVVVKQEAPELAALQTRVGELEDALGKLRGFVSALTNTQAEQQYAIIQIRADAKEAKDVTGRILTNLAREGRKG